MVGGSPMGPGFFAPPPYGGGPGYPQQAAYGSAPQPGRGLAHWPQPQQQQSPPLPGWQQPPPLQQSPLGRWGSVPERVPEHAAVALTRPGATAAAELASEPGFPLALEAGPGSGMRKVHSGLHQQLRGGAATDDAARAAGGAAAGGAGSLLEPPVGEVH
jgi:hypothetical protein